MNVIPPGSRVATTGTFKVLTDPRAWIQARGSIHVIWSKTLTYLLVGSNYRPDAWKMQEAKLRGIPILYESELPTPPKDLWVDQYRPKALQGCHWTCGAHQRPAYMVNEMVYRHRSKGCTSNRSTWNRKNDCGTPSCERGGISDNGV